MKTSTLRQIIKEEIAQSSASELLSMLAHPDFKRQLSILNNDSVNNAYENLYATLMGIERNEPLNENTSGVDYISVKIKKVLREVYFPYQINDERGKELYTKSSIALDDDEWMEKFNQNREDNYMEIYPLGQFLAKTRMSMGELEELMDNYGDESWSMYLVGDDMLHIEHD